MQRSFNLLRFRRRRAGYAITEHLHLPLDTYAQLRNYKPDVILSCQFGARTLLAVFYRIAHPHVRLILWAALSSHTESSRGRVREALRSWMLGQADGVFVNGKSGELYVRQLGFHGKVFSIPTP